jgi:hypothetical protein
MLYQTDADPVSTTETRIDRLTAASLRRVIEPEVEVTGSVGSGMVLAKELLSVADLDLDLTDEQWTALSREELASILDAGVRFESVLMAGFGLMLAWQKDLVDPRVTYVLHEIGEETRHSRLFVRVIEQLDPKAVNPFTRGVYRRVDRFITSRAVTRQALFCVLVLTGEEVPDLIQKRSSEHRDTDPFVRAVNRYHRLEEARHLAFARTLLPEVWDRASVFERFVIRHFGPAIMTSVVDSLIHPGVYRAVGLPGWRTWSKARKTQGRRDLKMEAFRPIFEALRTAGAFGDRGRVPRAWRQIGERAFHERPSGA